MPPIVILGPTAGGKSDLAVELAERLKGEIIGADSMQVYRHMDVGTAKPPPELRNRAKHHLIDIVEPTEPFTVHDWLGRAEALIADMQSRGVRPIVVGGTNLYIKALLEGLFEGPPADPAFRASLDAFSPQQLHERLTEVDPAAAERISRNDRRRIVRALEVYEATGKPISEHQTQWDDAPRSPKPEARNPILIGLHWPPEAINPRINARVKLMFHPTDDSESLPDETARLEAAGMLGKQAREALGYKQVLAALAGEMTLDEAMEKTKIQTRRFAKQQRTWLRRFGSVRWLEAGGAEIRTLADAAKDVVNA